MGTDCCSSGRCAAMLGLPLLLLAIVAVTDARRYNPLLELKFSGEVADSGPEVGRQRRPFAGTEFSSKRSSAETDAVLKAASRHVVREEKVETIGAESLPYVANNTVAPFDPANMRVLRDLDAEELGKVVQDPDMQFSLASHRLGETLASSHDRNAHHVEGVINERHDEHAGDPVLDVHDSLEAAINESVRARAIQRKLHRRTVFRADNLFFPADAVHAFADELRERYKASAVPSIQVDADSSFDLNATNATFEDDQLDEPLRARASRPAKSFARQLIAAKYAGEPNMFEPPCGRCLKLCGAPSAECCDSCMEQLECRDQDACRKFTVHSWAVNEHYGDVAVDRQADDRARAASHAWDRSKMNWRQLQKDRAELNFVSSTVMKRVGNGATKLDKIREALKRMAKHTKSLMAEASGLVAHGEIVTTIPYFAVENSADYRIAFLKAMKADLSEALQIKPNRVVVHATKKRRSLISVDFHLVRAGASKKSSAGETAAPPSALSLMDILDEKLSNHEVPFTRLHAFLAKRQFPNVSEEKLKMAKFDRKSFRTVLISLSADPVPEKKPGTGEKTGGSDENSDRSLSGIGNAQASSESIRAGDSSAGEPDLSANSTTSLRIKGLMRQMVSATNNLTQVALNVTRVKQAKRRAGNVSQSNGEFRAEPLGFLGNRSRELLFEVAAGKASAAVSDITGSADALLNRRKSSADSNGDSVSGDAAKVDDDDDDEEEEDEDGSAKGESKDRTASQHRLKKEMSVASRLSALKALKKMNGIKRRLRELGSIVLPSKKVKDRDASLASDSGREAVVQETDPNTGAVSYRKMSLQERLDAADAKSLIKMVKADMNNNTDVYTVVAKLKLLSNSSGNLTSNKTLLGNMQTEAGMPNAQRLTREANASFDSDLLLAPASMEGVTPKAAEALQAARQYGAVRRFALAIRASTEARLANITRVAADANASLMSPSVVAAAQSGNNGAVGVANKSLAGVNQDIPQQDIIKEQKKLEHTNRRVEDLLEQGKLPESQLHANLGTVASSIMNLVNHLQDPLKSRSNLNSTLNPRQNSTNSTVSLDASAGAHQPHGGKQHKASNEEAEFTDEEYDELPEPKNSSKKVVQRSLKLKLSSDYHWARHHETKFRLALQGDIAETLNLESSAVSIDTIEPGSGCAVVQSYLRQTLEVGESHSTSEPGSGSAVVRSSPRQTLQVGESHSTSESGSGSAVVRPSPRQTLEGGESRSP